MSLDVMSTRDAVALMNDNDRQAVEAVAKVSDQVVRAVEVVANAILNGGRLIYFGAGTSGRLGVLDATECPPTFGVSPDLIQGVMAGGEQAMFRSQEGAEDSFESGEIDVDAKQVGPLDVIMGIAAGGTTPYVHGALSRAKLRGAMTIFLSCAEAFEGEIPADVIIRPVTGPEVLTGSTRLKAGTATKLVLNQITTLAMVRLGKVYENLMVDVRVTNSKLLDRSIRIVSTLTALPRDRASELLNLADQKLKTAIVMHALGVDLTTADVTLENAGGSLRRAMERKPLGS